jgi:protein TonB
MGRPSGQAGAVQRDWGVPTPEVREATSVDSPVEVLASGPVPYPPLLRQSGVEGVVELEFVVDTSGRAEPRSVEVVRPARPEFEAAARRAVVESRFRPARLGGQAVRQRVRQRITFRLAQ